MSIKEFVVCDTCGVIICSRSREQEHKETKTDYLHHACNRCRGAKDTGLIVPERTKDGIPECSQDCPSKVAGICSIQECHPGLLCRPAVAQMAAAWKKEAERP